MAARLRQNPDGAAAMLRFVFCRFLLCCLWGWAVLWTGAGRASASGDLGRGLGVGLDERINAAVQPGADFVARVIFFEVAVAGQGVPLIVLWLAGSGIFLTVWFRGMGFWSWRLAWRTIRLKYARADDPGEITHFQALATALSGTVGLGNLGGVAIGLVAGGPGAAFWLWVAGFLGMTMKFCECTLGVRYRELVGGRVYGGSFHVLRKGLAERGWGRLGRGLAGFFAVCCVGAAFGGGNMFQVNQAFSQWVGVTGGAEGWWHGKGWLFGLGVAGLTAAILWGGLKGLVRVTDTLTPVMCVLYGLSCLFLLCLHWEKIPAALGLIVTEAFDFRAAAGGGMAAMVWGFRRAGFSNEAGFGSSPIVHAAVKTRYPASEGYVALLEPFVDTVVICSLTALVLMVTGAYEAGGTNGIAMTSAAFASGGVVFPYLLCAAALCFALSTLISWSYYGLQAWVYLFGRGPLVEAFYKLLFCLGTVLGACSSLDHVVDFSDAMMFAMCFPNLIGLYFLLPVIKEERDRYRVFCARVESGRLKTNCQDLPGG